MRNMAKIANINLDIRKNVTIDNEPIVLRQGDSDVTIEASISNDGYPNVEIDFATFAAKKPDGTIISNDPANVNGNTISYPISKHLTDSVGKIHDAYFMINNKITTSGFDISIIPSAQLDENSVNYFPGLEDINKFLKFTETDWLGRIQQMKAQIAGLSIPDEFKLLMDKALSDAKAQYQPIIDAAQENVENIAADLAAKKLDLQNNSDELNATIAAIKAQIAPVNSFLDEIQKQIIATNASFTADQQAKVSQSISDLKAQVSQSIANLKAQTDALVSGSAFQSLQTQVDNSAVGTNLLINTSSSATNGQTVMSGASASITGVYSRTDSYEQVTAPSSGEFYYRFMGPDNYNLYGLTPGETYTLSGSVSHTAGELMFRAQYSTGGTGWNNLAFTNFNGNDLGIPVSDGSVFTSFSHAFTIPAGAIGVYFGLQNFDYTAGSQFRFKNMKLEKGSVATDWCPNSSEILTQSNYAKIKAAIVALGGSLS